jgi:diaminopimelate epimerase
MEITFLKMHGAGNDFVILDGRERVITLSPEQVAQMSDRHRGVGCDQLILVKNSTQADVQMVIYNADGSTSKTCGNATRCVAWLLMEETGSDAVTIETAGGMLAATRVADGDVSVDMGTPKCDWKDIPLAKECDTLHVPIELEALRDPVGVSMGNPHLVFFVKDTKAVDLARLGPILEHHPLLPERGNISVASIDGKEDITLRVWERGVGETLACGSAACACLVAASRRGLVERNAKIHLPGGTLSILWNEQDHVVMRGPVAMSFTGVIGV